MQHVMHIRRPRAQAARRRGRPGGGRSRSWLAGAAQAKKPSVSQKGLGARSRRTSSRPPRAGEPVTLYSLKSAQRDDRQDHQLRRRRPVDLVPDRTGHQVNVALGFPKLSDYVNDFTQGATGRRGRCQAGRATRTSARSSAGTRTGSPTRRSRSTASPTRSTPTTARTRSTADTSGGTPRSGTARRLSSNSAGRAEADHGLTAGGRGLPDPAEPELHRLPGHR